MLENLSTLQGESKQPGYVGRAKTSADSTKTAGFIPSGPAALFAERLAVSAPSPL